MAVNPQEVYDFWHKKRYMQALQTIWELSLLDTYMSLRRDDMPLRELVVRACREAVTQAEQEVGRAKSQQWLAGFLQHFTLPAALVDYYGKGDDSEVDHLSTIIYAYLRCVEVVLDQLWTSTTVVSASLQPIAEATGLSLGFLRDLTQDLLAEAPDGAQRRPVAGTRTLAVLLVDEARNAGVVADLTLERLPDGTGDLYPAPELSFVYGDDAWQQAMQHASTYVKQTLWRQDWDVRWRLARRDQQPLPPVLEGGSLGAALALGLTKLAGGVQKLDVQGIALTATMDAQGHLGKIEGEFAKLLAVARERTLPRIHTVVVAEAQRQDVERLDASLLRDDPQADLRVICATTLKDAEQLLVIEKQTRWGEIIDCTQELDRHRDVVGRAWLHEWVQACVNNHASGYVLLTGGPGVGKSAFISEQVRQGQPPVVYHAIKRGMGNWDEPEAMLQSLTTQLRRKYALPRTDTEARMTPGAALLSALQRVSKSLREGQKEVIYLDGLDEAFGPTGRFPQVALPGILPRYLPERIMMVLTSRPGEHLYWLADSEICTTRDFEPAAYDNMDDIRRYLRQQNDARRLGLEERFLARLVEASEGYFIVAVLYLRARPELQTELQAWQKDPMRIPRGLIGWLTEQWQHILHPPSSTRPVQRRRRVPSSEVMRGVLGLLAMAREPLSRNHLMAFLTADARPDGRRRRGTRLGFLSLRELQRHLETVLDLTQEFFDPRDPAQGAAAPYRFFHTRFPEFITVQLTEMERQSCHRLLAQGCTAVLSSDAIPSDMFRSYAFQRRLAHLMAGQDWLGVVMAFADTLRSHMVVNPVPLPRLGYLKDRLSPLLREQNWPVAAWEIVRALADTIPSDMVREYALRHRLAHLMAVQDWSGVVRAFADTDYVVERSERFTFADVYGDALTAVQATASAREWHAAFRAWEQFLRRRSECLRRFPGTYAQEVYNEFLPTAPQRFTASWPLGPTWLTSGLSLRKTFGPPSLLDLVGHSDTVTSVTWAPDGHAVASSSKDRTVKVWEARSGQLLADCVGHQDTVTSVVWAPDGHAMASGSEDRTVKVWDARSGQLLADCVGHKGAAVESVAWAPDGRAVASGGRDGTVKVWDARSGRLLADCIVYGDLVGLEGCGLSSVSVAWAPNGRAVASGGGVGGVKVWDAQSGRLIANCAGHYGPAKSVAWAPDGHAVMTGGRDRTVRVWDAQSGRLIANCVGHQGEVQSVAWAPDGHVVASGSEDKTVKVWDAQSGECRTSLFFAHAPIAVTFLPGQPFRLVIADRSGRLFGYELVQ